METASKTTQETVVQENGKKKTSFGQKFMNFLMYGGFIVLLIAAVVIVILVEKFLK
jgi:uncharacterized RDD family membrane protein YckC